MTTEQKQQILALKREFIKTKDTSIALIENKRIGAERDVIDKVLSILEADKPVDAGKWNDVRQIRPETYKMVYWLTEEGDQLYGFYNAQGDYMKGSQGRWASRYTDIDNIITHWIYAFKSLD